jgi:tetratricopeptide (TPR) repeat protein
MNRGLIAFLPAILALIGPASISDAQLLGNRTEATSCASAIGGNVTDSKISVVCGIPAEVLDQLVRSRTEPLEELVGAHRQTIALLKQNLDLNERQIRSALNAAGEVNVAPEQLAAKLVEIGEHYNALRTAAAPQPGDTAKVTALKGEIQSAIERGELAQADQLLADIEKLQDEQFDRLALTRAETSAQRGDVALTRLRYAEAAGHFAAAAGKVPAEREDVRLGYRGQEAHALWLQGSEFGDNAAASAAIERYRFILTFRSRERAPLAWAATQNRLCIALRTLGRRESGTARLDEAVVACREALKEQTRERVPLAWAMTQNNLGLALARLGERESGTARLDEAVVAYREALKERTRERMPLAWANAQSNLGYALMALGRRESGTARLDEAVVALREALKEHTRERMPLAWANAQSSLGNALMTLGRRESGTARLDEGVVALREALKELTRERLPLYWATTKNNLGVALMTLGERESGTARLHEAIVAYSDALKERTRERVPLAWAETQNNLGNALQTLSERESGTVRLDEAVVAYREALKERTRERVPLAWAGTQYNLGGVLQAIGLRTRDQAHLNEALSAVDGALEVLRASHIEPRIAQAEQLRASILAALAQKPATDAASPMAR